MIIALTGPMGSGKSTVIEMLQQLHFFKNVKFAQPLYDMQQMIYRRIYKPVPKPKDRKLLQWLGTEWGRSVDENLWVNLWKEVVDRTTVHGVYVVSDDCRFDNEAEMVHSMGGKVVEIVCPAEIRGTRIKLENTGHSSEKGIKKEYVDYRLVNTGDLNSLKSQVEEMFTSFYIPKT